MHVRYDVDCIVCGHEMFLRQYKQGILPFNVYHTVSSFGFEDGLDIGVPHDSEYWIFLCLTFGFEPFQLSFKIFRLYRIVEDKALPCWRKLDSPLAFPDHSGIVKSKGLPAFGAEVLRTVDTLSTCRATGANPR